MHLQRKSIAFKIIHSRPANLIMYRNVMLITIKIAFCIIRLDVMIDYMTCAIPVDSGYVAIVSANV